MPGRRDLQEATCGRATTPPGRRCRAPPTRSRRTRARCRRAAWLQRPSHAPRTARHPRAPACRDSALLRVEACAKRGDDHRVALVALGGERALAVSDEPLAEGGVCFGAGHAFVQ